jgi:uncharacterized membrane protein HdeD (DUF308 family)
VKQALIRTSWLLALCGVLYAIFSFVILFWLSPNGSPLLRSFATPRGMVPLLGIVALAAGACTITAAIWNASQARSWFLLLNGLTCIALGLLLNLGANRPVAFRTIALLIALMAASIAVHELVIARALRGLPVGEWLLAGAGVVSVGFAGVFSGFALGWIRLEPSPSGETFYWLGSYFAFSALCMLGLALRQLRPPAPTYNISDSALPAR